MEWIRTYLIRITVAAMVVSAANTLCANDAMKRVVRLCGGLCLALVVIGPVLQVDTSQLLRQYRTMEADGSQLSQDTAEYMQEQMAQIISEQTETYILDKAAACQADIEVEVETEPFGTYYCQPIFVTITGVITVEQKTELAQYIQDELGLTEEQIRWNANPRS